VITSDSPMRRIPVDFDNEKTVFVDGMRHAAEIADFAYQRLKKTLADLSSQQPSGNPMAAQAATSAFLDAWTVIDEGYRFVKLLRGIPRLDFVSELTPDQIEASYEQVINLRNVADHLHERVAHVVAKKSAALGILRWHALGPDGNPAICYLLPGSAEANAAPIRVNEALNWQGSLGQISLNVARYSVYLEFVLGVIERDVHAFEAALRRAYVGLSPQIRRSDTFVIQSLKDLESLLAKHGSGGTS
jgi:hypothetical protein